MSAVASPVFVVGCPRSGTSALAWALAEHPALWTSAESDWLGLLFGEDRLQRSYARATERGPRQWLSKHHVAFEDWAAALGSGADRLYREQSGGRGWIEQTPSYVLHVDALCALFPSARFVHLVRHGAQVVDSLLHSGFDFELARGVRRASHGWVRHVRAGLAAERRHPGRVLRVVHDRLVRDPEAQCRGIQAFLDVDDAPEAAAYLRAQRLNSSFTDARQAPLDEAFAGSPEGGWSAWQRFQFRRVAGSLMRELGFA